ncbi:MAG: glycosyltransferase family 2 protein [Patescibacteria group bacterium]|nr:glycosyltransferase family 2 protein [Patescibacteria group bacterium]
MNNKKIAIVISPNWGDYAKKYLRGCIDSIRRQDYRGEKKIFITDNETTPESFEFLSKTAPEAELVLNSKNDGFAKGCNDSMRMALTQGFDYIFLVSIHSILKKNCVSELARAIETDKKIAVAQARMMMAGEDDIINSLGNDTHFLGFGYCRGYKKKWENQVDKIVDIFYPSGASMFFRREALERVGLFDEEYWMYNEDQELPWRLRLNGWRCVLAPNAAAYTKYEFKHSIEKFYWMDRNRIISILVCYKLLTLILILPAFIIMELGHILFSLKTGWFKEKIKVWKYFLKLKTWAYLRQARKRNQALRKINEFDIIKLISGKIWYQEIDDWKLRVINPIFEIYWKICKFVIIW